MNKKNNKNYKYKKAFCNYGFRNYRIYNTNYKYTFEGSDLMVNYDDMICPDTVSGDFFKRSQLGSVNYLLCCKNFESILNYEEAYHKAMNDIKAHAEKVFKFNRNEEKLDTLTKCNLVKNFSFFIQLNPYKVFMTKRKFNWKKAFETAKLETVDISGEFLFNQSLFCDNALSSDDNYIKELLTHFEHMAHFYNEEYERYAKIAGLI